LPAKATFPVWQEKRKLMATIFPASNLQLSRYPAQAGFRSHDHWDIGSTTDALLVEINLAFNWYQSEI
jgi:hypothetical protein